MTDQPPPSGPDFEPPGADHDRRPGEHPEPPPVGGAHPEPTGGPVPQPLQPGPLPYQPTPDYATAAPGGTGGRGSIVLGVGIAMLALILDWLLWVAVPPSSDLSGLTFSLAGFLPFGLLLAGIVLAAIPRTTRTGAGILLAIGGVVLIVGGLCIALISSLSR